LAKSILFAFLFCATTCFATDKYTKVGYLDKKIGFGELSILKISPSFYSRWAPRGVVVGYETGAGVNYWSLNFSLKYFSGVDSVESFSPISEYVRLELHPRFWVTDFMNGFFFCPILAVYNTGDVAGGIAFGGQFHLTQRLLMDTYSGIQTSTPIENLNGGIYLKFGMNLGFQISK